MVKEGVCPFSLAWQIAARIGPLRRSPLNLTSHLKTLKLAHRIETC